MARPLGPVPIHGSRSRYQLRGDPCRCADCRCANTAYLRRYRATLRQVRQLTLPREYLTGWVREDDVA